MVCCSGNLSNKTSQSKTMWGKSEPYFHWISEKQIFTFSTCEHWRNGLPCNLNVLCVCVQVEKLEMYLQRWPIPSPREFHNTLKKSRPGPGAVRMRLYWARRSQWWGTFSQITWIWGGKVPEVPAISPSWGSRQWTPTQRNDNPVRPTKKMPFYTFLTGKNWKFGNSLLC